MHTALDHVGSPCRFFKARYCAGHLPSKGFTLDAADVARKASALLPRFAKPRFVRVMDHLPKTATGKIQRAILRQQGSAGAYDSESVDSTIN